MHALTVAEPSRPLEADAEEELIRRHFEPLFRFMNFFVEDGALALRLAERAFRQVIEGGLCSPVALYHAACDALRSLPRLGIAIDSLERESALCWLLKDLAGLRYREIATVLSLEPLEVRTRIAAARGLDLRSPSLMV